MNYIRDFINRLNLENNIDSFFEQFIEEINELPFNTDYEYSPEFQLNQSIVNQAYSLRRNIELYPQLYINNNTNNNINNTNNINIHIDNIHNNDTHFIYSSLWNNRRNLLFASLFNEFNDFTDFLDENLTDFNTLEDIKIALTEEEFNNLDTVNNPSIIENKQCNICLDEFTSTDLDTKHIIQLKCNHIYHKNCIKEWLTKQSTKCPSCRFCCKTDTEHVNEQNIEHVYEHVYP